MDKIYNFLHNIDNTNFSSYIFLRKKVLKDFGLTHSRFINFIYCIKY